MKVDCHLTVNKNGSVRVTKGKPDLSFDEVTIGLSLTLPDALFKKPILSAQIVVPDEAALNKAIEATITDDFKDAIKTAIGTEVRITFNQE